MSKPVYVISAEYGRSFPEAAQLAEGIAGEHDARLRANLFRTATSLRDQSWMKEIGKRIAEPDGSRPTHIPPSWEVEADKPTLSGMMQGAVEACVEAIPEAISPDLDGLFMATMGSVVTQPVDTELQPMELLDRLEERFPSRFLPGRPRVAVSAPGTSESGALALLRAVTWLRSRRTKGTVLAVAAQMMPPGRLSVDALRRMLGARDQMARMTMPVVGDLLMDHLRREAGQSVESTLEATRRVTEAKFERVKRYPAAALYDSGDRRRAAHAIVAEREQGFQAKVAQAWGMDRPERVPPFHRHMRVSDIAPAALGGVAVMLTTDRGLALRCLSHGAASGRLARSTLVAVTGIGEGSMGSDVLLRPFPPGWVESIRKAYAMICQDAGVGLRALRELDFAVLHDAFPSIELSFLLSMGLDWDEAWGRMERGWCNPVGGLTTFGHAVGASGLVQLAKASHVMQADRRYLLPSEAPGDGLLDRGAVPGDRCLVTSVGGPLTHIAMALIEAQAPTPLPPLKSKTSKSSNAALLPCVLLSEQCRAVRRIFSVKPEIEMAPGLFWGVEGDNACYLVGRSVWWHAPADGEEQPRELGVSIFARGGRLRATPEGRPEDLDRVVLLSRRGGGHVQAPESGAECGFSLAWWKSTVDLPRPKEGKVRRKALALLREARRAEAGVRPSTEARIYRRVFEGVHGVICASDEAGVRRGGWAVIALLLAPEVKWAGVVGLLERLS